MTGFAILLTPGSGPGSKQICHSLGFSLVGLPWAALLLGLAWPSAGTVRVPYRIG